MMVDVSVYKVSFTLAQRPIINPVYLEMMRMCMVPSASEIKPNGRLSTTLR